MRRFLILALVWLLSPAVYADSFQLSLGGGPIGTLEVTTASITSSVTDSPMGLANGRFTATAKMVRTEAGDTVLQYFSDAPEKARQISVLMKDGKVLETAISPADDRTDLSVPEAVPAGVTHPVGALNNLLNAQGCPAVFRYYDGRRVVTLSPDGAEQDKDRLTCDMTYRVTAGPGHLSPLYIARASLRLIYQTAPQQRLSEIQLSSGPFTLYVTR